MAAKGMTTAEGIERQQCRVWLDKSDMAWLAVEAVRQSGPNRVFMNDLIRAAVREFVARRRKREDGSI